MQCTTHEVNPVAQPDRTREVVQWFGLESGQPELALPAIDPAILRAALPAPGQITLVTGASGAGKSTLLRAVGAASGHPVPPRRRHPKPNAHRAKIAVRPIDKDALPVANVVDLFPGQPIERIVGRLAWTGLGEASVLLRNTRTLSDGERFRLALCLALDEPCQAPADPTTHTLLVCDEFTSTLDDGSAVACASTLRRAISASTTLSAVVATWREELTQYLRPEVVIRCDYGLWEVTRAANGHLPNSFDTC